ncbi:MAG: hypothetical protein ABH864_05965 [archaeon]
MLIEVVVLLLAILIGFLIAYWANDELVAGRKWFRVIIGVSIVVGGWFAFQGNWSVVWTCGFIMIATGISCWKSFDKNWVKKRI